MVGQVPAHWALRASLAPATSTPPSFWGPGLWSVRCLEIEGVRFRVLGPGETVWVPVRMLAFTGLVPW